MAPTPDPVGTPIDDDREKRKRNLVIIAVVLPAGLDHPRNLAAEGETSEAQPTHLEFSIEGPGAPADEAAIVASDGELGRSRRLHSKTGLCHSLPPFTLRRVVSAWPRPQLRNGIPRARSSAFPSASVPAVVTTHIVSPKIFSTLSRSISVKMVCSWMPSE